ELEAPIDQRDALVEARAGRSVGEQRLERVRDLGDGLEAHDARLALEAVDLAARLVHVARLERRVHARDPLGGDRTEARREAAARHVPSLIKRTRSSSMANAPSSATSPANGRLAPIPFSHSGNAPN